MITIYIHAGTQKTGTSAIQAFLNYNRENLFKKNSCLYPNFLSLPIDKGQNCHNHCRSINRPKDNSILDDIDKAVAFCRKKNISKIIISAEGFLAKPAMGKQIAIKFQAEKDLSLRIIVFLRRQDHFLESSWKQWGVKDIRFTSIGEYIEKQNVQWLDNLRDYESFFGKENIIVCPYEKEQLPGGLITEFLALAGIRYADFSWAQPPPSNLNQNFGFNRDILEMIRLNKTFHKNIDDNRLQSFLSDTLPDSYRKKPFERYDLLSPEQRLKILNRYNNMNQTIAREYLGRKDGKLFYEPWPDPDEPWEPYEGLTVEKIVPIFTMILYSMQEKFNSRKKKPEPNRGFIQKMRDRIQEFSSRICRLI